MKKVWDDAQNQDGLRPSTITVHLLANGEEVQTATLSGEGDTWSHSFTDLPVYKNGQTRQSLYGNGRYSCQLLDSYRRINHYQHLQTR
ncbi:MAG: Cna B-type domain-containing protein [Streptococcus sp.]